MLSIVKSISLQGLDGVLVKIEVDISSGLPSWDIIGLPDVSVKESKERVRTAIKNCGINLLSRKYVINLSPANIKKEGSIFDLAIAIGILKASKEIRNDVSVNVAQNTFQPLNCSNVYQNSDECTLIKNENNSQLIDVENLSDSEILNVVANSINPYTGEKITGIDNSLKRKLMGISSKREMGEKREIINEIIKNIPCDERNSNVGRRWTEEEEQQLIDEFKQNLKIGEISKLHKRKAGGIKSRLKRLGLIDED